MKHLFSAVCILLAFPAISQPGKIDTIAKAQIIKLAFITGEWKGSGWVLGADKQKHYFDQTEKVQFKLDSTALLIEGVGKTNGIVTHNALAIITFVKSKEHFNFQSYLSSGHGGSFKAELLANRLYWYPSDNMRYIIYLTDKGQWYETGEINQNGQWMQFFEMTLNKL